MEKLKKHYTSIVLAGYIIFLFVLLATGNIRRFINPRLSFLSVLALLMFSAMFFASLRKDAKHDKHEHHCECCHHEMEHFSKANLILLLPLFLAICVAPETLSYQASNTDALPPLGSGSSQIQITAPSGPLPDMKLIVPAEQPVPVKYEEYTQLDIGNILFDTRKSAKQKLTGSKVFLQGLVLRSPELNADEVVVYRMVISCCVADGIPLGVTVKLPEGTQFNNGEWIGVEGTIQWAPFRDELKNIEPVVYMVPPEKTFAYFTATRAYRMEAPREQYLF